MLIQQEVHIVPPHLDVPSEHVTSRPTVTCCRYFPLQELRASETELGELHEAYTLVWDELQEQRAAVNSAMSQCVALQRQMDRVNGERSGSRTARSC